MVNWGRLTTGKEVDLQACLQLLLQLAGLQVDLQVRGTSYM
jgi:hypothetical protein